MINIKELERTLYSAQLGVNKANRLIRRFYDLKTELNQIKQGTTIKSKLAEQHKLQELEEVVLALEKVELVDEKYTFSWV